MTVPLSTALDPEAEARAALARGDRESALRVLMAAYGPDLYRPCEQVLGRPELVEDVHQMVFVQAFRDLAAFAGRGSLRAWLYSIARHRCLDALKANRRWRRRFLLRERPPEAVDPNPGAEAQLAGGAEAQALSACLARLDPEVRIAVLLRYQDGLSYEEMAKICNARPATLQARVARALPRLRHWLIRLGARDGL
jgi:RNA polymerase sigma-70 factor (ECF subfamily)